jgi:predicted double-glycine peptidase
MRRTPIVLQSEAAECGIACLAMVSGAHGRRMDLPAIRRHHDVSLKGTTLRDLIHVAGDIDLNTRALRAELHHLKQLRLPCILHWEHNHFVVLTRVGAHLTIHDPRVGERRSRSPTRPSISPGSSWKPGPTRISAPAMNDAGYGSPICFAVPQVMARFFRRSSCCRSWWRQSSSRRPSAFSSCSTMLSYRWIAIC